MANRSRNVEANTSSRPSPFFIFATGIENSCPTIDGGRTRFDQMEASRHYDLWSLDFDLVQSLGIHFLRYGPVLHRTWLGPNRYDWSFTDATFASLFARDLIPVADLCHFGVPDWIGNFQNPDFPTLFPSYAQAFAARYPWVQFYTPVNEMFVCALFSARYGWWNEQMRSDRAFVTALKHIVSANVLASKAILEVRPDAIFIQSESTEYFHALFPDAAPAAEKFNARRFLPLDLNYGHEVDAATYQFLLDNGMSQEEYRAFRTAGIRHHCILGNDYYPSNEHFVTPDEEVHDAGEIFGFDEIARQYYDRYKIPLMHTETNVDEGCSGDEAVKWLHKQWANVLRVRDNGIPIVGFTWYSLIDQVDWDSLLRTKAGTVNRRGLFDMDRNIRPVGRAYKKLIARWEEVLPAQSACLTVPFVLPSEYDEPMERRRRDWIRKQHDRWFRA
ncbi:family 1 glycosylhydrolase [Allosphingosinicella flava]|uniref:Family 1 glycosylhydrolase n=1 Tax=Allosphingosinicella flava TaxID=2771430 RepID=A0A7T2LLX9_9SPHN|nr:family 1 glycosylhydrolase [Sphingosinicella flava]QPQ54971.1 family 1 glycosylhydrolase [Sphingosinicella flava]